MKKSLCTLCLIFIMFCTVQRANAFVGIVFTAIDMGISTTEKVTKHVSDKKEEKATGEKLSRSEKKKRYKEQFRTNITNSENNLIEAKALQRNAHMELAEVLLPKEDVESFKTQLNDINSNTDLSDKKREKALKKADEALVETLNKTVKSKEFDYTYNIKDVDEQKYINAVTNMQIAHNRYDNIVNTMSPSLNVVLQKKVCALTVGKELKRSGKISVNVQSATSNDSKLLKRLNKINDQNNIYIQIPDSEKVVFNKDGVIGGINYELFEINATVDKSYSNLINAFNLNATIDKEKAIIKSIDGMSIRERNAQIKMMETNVLAQELRNKTIKNSEGKIEELTEEQKAAVLEAKTDLSRAAKKAYVLSAKCAVLGYKIYRNPFLAVPLAPEVPQLKYTGKFLKEACSSLKKVSTQSRKLSKIHKLSTKELKKAQKEEAKLLKETRKTKKSKKAKKVKNIDLVEQEKDDAK